MVDGPARWPGNLIFENLWSLTVTVIGIFSTPSGLYCIAKIRTATVICASDARSGSLTSECEAFDQTPPTSADDQPGRVEARSMLQLISVKFHESTALDYQIPNTHRIKFNERPPHDFFRGLPLRNLPDRSTERNTGIPCNTRRAATSWMDTCPTAGSK
jgi:hypothetical protein